MVEKIIINPTKVRAYGNIIGAKDSTDYDTYNAYITEITDTVYGSTSNVFSMECEPHISLTATNPYMLSGETTDLVVSLVNAFGSPLSGKTVTISDGTSVYNGLTNLNGIFTLYNVSVSEDTTFTATYSSVSDSIVVEYCTMVDYGVTNNNNLIQWYYAPTYSSASVDESGTTFTAIRAGSYATVSATLTQNPSSTDIYIYSFPLTVEFDLIGWQDNQGSTSDYARIRVYNSANNKVGFWNFNSYGVGHYKIVCTEGSQKLYYNGVEQSRSFTFTPTTAWNVAFQTKGNIKFRNFRIKAL